MKNRADESITYTSASPLNMDSTNGKQVRLFTYRESDNTWLAYENLENIVNHDIYFDMDETMRGMTNNELANISATASTNKNDIAALEHWLRIPVVTNYSISNNQNVLYDVVGLTNNNRQINISTSHGLLTQRTNKYVIRNTSDQYWVKVVNDTGNFQGMSDDELWLKPGETRYFINSYDGSSYVVTPIGEVFYDFNIEAGVLLPSANWSFDDMGNTPTGTGGLIEFPTGNTDRIKFNVPCILKDLTLDTGFIFTGTAAADFSALASLTPSLTLHRSGSIFRATHNAHLLNLGGSETFLHTVFDSVTMSADQYLTFTGTDVTNISVVTTTLRGKMVVKEN
jgi:hypothetical protein